MRLSLIYLFIICSIPAMSQSTTDRAMLNLIDSFNQQYYSFNPPFVTLDFKVNLRSQLDTRNPAEQKAFFSQVQIKLGEIDKTALSPDLQMDHGILNYETKLNLERLNLLMSTSGDSEIQSLNKIFDFTNGPEWYAWFIKKWTGTAMSPEEVMAFGEIEVERVKKRMSQLDLSQPKPASDYTQDVDQIIKTLEAKRKHIAKQLGSLMPAFSPMPELSIERGTNARMAQAPGYYNANTFYFNLFDKPFDLADCDWLLIHEGNPGHHFQVNFHNDLRVKPYRSGLRYMGFVEGWAAYTENLGWELGLYKSPYEELGKWNWDLIRSVRIVLDVGLNYHGWNDEKAMNYWQRHIQDQDDIGMREIKRMKRWPAQVLTYKMGEAAILKALEKEKRELGDAFNYKDFHTRILGSGTIPVALIPQLVKRAL